MRLINAETLQLEEFFADIAPPYAILSHTWGSEEVTFADIQNGGAIKKRGYLKIKYSCEQAIKDGLKYAWVDTCCIDKSSSAELSEAINSMYRWYIEAQVCYAFIEDISTSDSSLNSLNYLNQCRWFTRGWTLQELIAPSKLIFYDTKWVEFGTKLTLLSLLNEITLVDKEVLDGSLPVSEVSVARRMSWASKRQTTRIEDIAYCLLGIFDINMPLLYGEGNKAFGRLLEEILKDSDDHSIFAWKSLEKIHEQQTGFLPTSPLQYAESRDYAPFRAWGESIPYSLTNKGLRIMLEIHDTEDSSEIFLGTLNCWVKEGSTARVAVQLERLEGDQFCRISPTRLFSTLYGASANTNFSSRNIYIRNSVRQAQSSDLFRSGIIFSMTYIDRVQKWQVKDIAVPHNRWKPSTHSFYAEKSIGLVGLISFTTGFGNVLAALGVSHTGDGWCLMRSRTEYDTDLKMLFDDMKHRNNSRGLLERHGWSHILRFDSWSLTVRVAGTTKLREKKSISWLPHNEVNIHRVWKSGLERITEQIIGC